MSRRPSAAAREAKLDAVFAALSDPTRRQILAHLARGSASISEIAKPFSMTLPAVSKHVRVLERAGLTRRERDGWYHRCYLEARPLEDAVSFLAFYRPFWERTLEELARYIEAPDNASPDRASRERVSKDKGMGRP